MLAHLHLRHASATSPPRPPQESSVPTAASPQAPDETLLRLIACGMLLRYETSACVLPHLTRINAKLLQRSGLPPAAPDPQEYAPVPCHPPEALVIRCCCGRMLHLGYGAAAVTVTCVCGRRHLRCAHDAPAAVIERIRAEPKCHGVSH